MGQEFIIKSQDLEDKINQLLPSQGGFAAGVDLSASTQIIPIVDLTETAEGSLLRPDLQTCFSLVQITRHNVVAATTTIINTTGFFRVFGYVSLTADSSIGFGNFELTDGTTSKIIWGVQNQISVSPTVPNQLNYDFIVKLEAGDSLQATSNDSNVTFEGCTRQIADLSGNLVNP